MPTSASDHDKDDNCLSSTHSVGHHGALFTSHWTFPLPDSNDVVVIAGTASRGEARKTKVNRRLELMSMAGTSPIEVVFPANGSGGLTYLGAYTPQGVWQAFTQENIGNMQALVRTVPLSR